MSENTTIESATYEKGSWGDLLQKSTTLKERAGKASKQSGEFLWSGAKAAISDWDRAADSSGEALYEDVKEALGESRRGDASKIKTVALAVAGMGLDIEEHPNLSKAYAAAVKLLKTDKQDSADADTADDVLSSVEAPKSASSIEGAARLLLSKGVDGAVVALFDAIAAAAGDDDKTEAVVRNFIRAATTEAASRAKARVAAEKEKASEAAKAEREAEKAEREAKREATKAKREAAKAEAKPKPKVAKPAPKPEADKADEAPTEKPKPVAKPVTRPKPVSRPKPKA